MVERSNKLDTVFGSLSDPTRRDMLRRLGKKSMSIGELAAHYPVTFAAVAKHVEVLRRAKLVTKSRRGKEQIVSLVPTGLAAAEAHLESLQKVWEQRLGSLETFIINSKK